MSQDAAPYQVTPVAETTMEERLRACAILMGHTNARIPEEQVIKGVKCLVFPDHRNSDAMIWDPLHRDDQLMSLIKAYPGECVPILQKFQDAALAGEPFNLNEAVVIHLSSNAYRLFGDPRSTIKKFGMKA